MFLPVFLGCVSGYVCAALIVTGYNALRSKLANRRVDKHVKELVAALRDTGREDATTVVRVPIIKGASGEN